MSEQDRGDFWNQMISTSSGTWALSSKWRVCRDEHDAAVRSAHDNG